MLGMDIAPVGACLGVRDVSCGGTYGGILHAIFAHCQPVGPRERATRAALELFRYVVLVGHTEERWFRGFWLAMWRHRFVPSVLVGSLLFGLSHIARGLQTVWSTAFVGSVRQGIGRGGNTAASPDPHGPDEA